MKKLDGPAADARSKKCLSRAQGLKASDEKQYKCLAECTAKAKNFDEARACRTTCRGGKGGPPGGAVEGAGSGFGGLDDD